MRDTNPAAKPRSPREEFLKVGGDWAEMQPNSAWADGRPPLVHNEFGFYVAVRTETGRVLTGCLNVFATGSDRIEASPRYGKIIQWIPFGEPQ